MKKTTTRKIGEGTFWLSLSSIFMKVIGIAYVLLVLSHLSVTEYGFLELALSIPALLGFFSLAGLQPVLIADLTRIKNEETINKVRDTFSSYLSLRVVLAVFSATVLYGATLLLDTRFSGEVVLMVQLLCISLLLSPIRSVVTIALNIMHDFKKLAVFSFSEEAFKFLLVLLFLTVFNLGALGVVIAYVITDVSIALLFSFSILRMRSDFFEGKLLSSNISKPIAALNDHAKWSVFQTGVHLLGQNIRPWIIQMFLGVQAVGIYALAFGMYQHITSLFPLSKVIAPIVPSFIKNDRKLIGFVNTAIKYDVLIQIVLGLLSLIFIPVLIYTLFPTYASAYSLLVVLLIAMIPNSFSRIYESVFQALRLQKNLFSSNLVKFATTIVIAPIALFFFGVYGIAVEFFITSTIYSLGRYKVLRRVVPDYKLSLASLIRVTELDKIILQKTKVKLMSMLSFSRT